MVLGVIAEPEEVFTGSASAKRFSVIRLINKNGTRLVDTHPFMGE